MLYYPRSKWGAAPPSSEGFPIRTPAQLAVLHHSAGTSTGPAAVKAIQKYQMGNNYRDIAYKLLADSNAIYEGRDWRMADGATKGKNTVSASVCALGNFDHQSPTDDLLWNLAWAVVLLWEWGAVDRPEFDGGHRDYVQTACPGAHLYTKIETINSYALKVVAQKEWYPMIAVYAKHRSPEHSGWNGITNLFRPEKLLQVAFLTDAAEARRAKAAGAKVYELGATNDVPGSIKVKGATGDDTARLIVELLAKGL